MWISVRAISNPTGCRSASCYQCLRQVGSLLLRYGHRLRVQIPRSNRPLVALLAQEGADEAVTKLCVACESHPGPGVGGGVPSYCHSTGAYGTLCRICW